jgi:hypothetical protein
MQNYEKLLRGIEQDIKQAKQQETKQVIQNYTVEQDDYNKLGLSKSQQEDEYYEPIDDEDIELDEAELQAYMNLKKANKIVQSRESPNQLAAALLRSSKPINKSKDITEKTQDISLSKHLPWIHTLALHSFKSLDVKNHEDDIEREMALYVIVYYCHCDIH